MLGRGVPRGQEQGGVAGLPELEPWVDAGPASCFLGRPGLGPTVTALTRVMMRGPRYPAPETLWCEVTFSRAHGRALPAWAAPRAPAPPPAHEPAAPTRLRT